MQANLKDITDEGLTFIQDIEDIDLSYNQNITKEGIKILKYKEDIKLPKQLTTQWVTIKKR